MTRHDHLQGVEAVGQSTLAGSSAERRPSSARVGRADPAVIAPVLFIGGMDSSGGAGLLRDCATAAEYGVPLRVAVTAVTAQTDRKVTVIGPVEPKLIAAQIRAAGRVATVKIGMLASAPIAQAVAACLPEAPTILDPVLRSSSGHDLIDGAGTDVLIRDLMPKADLLTPNQPELAALAAWCGLPVRDEPAIVEALFHLGCRAVLTKGGHAVSRGFCDDRLYLPGKAPVTFRTPRVGATLRGTGCQLASAIAVQVALGRQMEAAIAEAKLAVQRRLIAVAGGPDKSSTGESGPSDTIAASASVLQVVRDGRDSPKFTEARPEI